MCWNSYRGDGKPGVENISDFGYDGTQRKKHPLLIDPSTDAPTAVDLEAIYRMLMGRALA